ncbi:MAG: 2-oxoacid:acceptor oxidoreductase family protein [Candidatus Asgardarchaeum sp.]
MYERIELRFGGIGGQGIITMGILVGHAAVVYDGKYAVQTQSYGPEARGSACRSEVVISNKPIDFPKVLTPDIFVCMSQEAYQKYISDLKKDGYLIVESNLVSHLNSSHPIANTYKIPALKIAEKNFKRPIVANMVMLGALVAITNVVSAEGLKKSIAERFPKYKEINLRAFDTGYSYASKIIGSVNEEKNR